MDLVEHNRHKTIPEAYFKGMIAHYKAAIFGYPGAIQWVIKNGDEPVVSDVRKFLDIG